MYREVPKLSLDAARTGLASADVLTAAESLVSVGLYEQDDEAAVGFLMKACEETRTEVRGAALLSLGHVARRFGRLPEGAMEVLAAGLVDPDAFVRGQAEDALSAVRTAVPALRRAASRMLRDHRRRP